VDSLPFGGMTYERNTIQIMVGWCEGNPRKMLVQKEGKEVLRLLSDGLEGGWGKKGCNQASM